MIARGLAFSLVAAVALFGAWYSYSGAAAEGAASFESAETAYIALKFDEARVLYRSVANASAQPAKERASAWRQLAVMAWRIAGNGAEAEADFRQALSVGADVSATNAERARFYRATGRFGEAIAAAQASVASAANEQDRRGAVLALALSVNAELKGVGLAELTLQQRNELERVRDLARPYSADPPMTLELSEALLESALHLDDGPLALTAWRSYAREAELAGPWHEAGRLLAASLPQIGAGASERVRDDVVEGLRSSQFFRLSALVAGDRRSSIAAERSARPRVRETIAYARFLDDVASMTDDYYRDFANKRGDSVAWTKGLFASGAGLWANFDFGRSAPAYVETALEGEIRARFGGYLNLGESGGVQDLHFGHVVVDDAREIDQYGHRAKLRRLAIDRMVSNGYESWVWDQRQAHGGWSTPEFLVQVRPLYADEALRRWAQITDPVLRAEDDKKIATDSAADEAIAARDETAFLPGLARRLQRQGYEALVAQLKAKGSAGRDLKQAFVIRLSQVVLDSNFFAHEGRHSLDRDFFGANEPAQEELEYRAKLSEVAFSDEPRLSFGSILNANIADETSPHGRANKRVVRGLIAWMKAHAGEIGGLDVARPLMPQFDKLSSEQMRAAMRSMDPWATK